MERSYSIWLVQVFLLLTFGYLPAQDHGKSTNRCPEGMHYFEKAETESTSYAQSREWMHMASAAFRECADWEMLVYTYCGLYGLSFLQAQFDSCAHYAHLADSLYNRYLPAKHPALPTLLSNRGAILYTMGRYDESYTFYANALQALEDIDHHPIVRANILQNLGNYYQVVGAYDQALAHYDQALRLQPDTITYLQGNSARILKEMSACFRELGDDTAQQAKYNLALKGIRQLNLDHESARLSAVDQWYERGRQFYESAAWDSVLMATKQLLDVSKTDVFEQQIDAWLLRADAYGQIGQLEEAKISIDRASELARRFFKGTGMARKSAEIALATARIAAHEKNTAQVLHFVRQAHRQNQIDPTTNAFLQNTQTIGALDRSLQTSILHMAAQWFEKRYQMHGSREDLDSMGLAYDLAIKQFRERRGDIRSVRSKKKLASDHHSLFSQAVGSALQLGRGVQYEDGAARAFDLNERFKLLLFQERLQSAYALSGSELPDSLQRRERVLAKAIAKLDEEIGRILRSADTSQAWRIHQLRASKFQSQQQYEWLIDRFESDYPKYYEQKFADEIPSVQDIQAALDEDELLIEYFWGTEDLYAFCISNRGLQAKVVGSVSDIKTHVEAVTKWLHAKAGQVSERLESQAYQSRVVLADELMHWIDTDVIEQSGRLTIIPDGLLHALPFDVLLIQSPNGEHSAEDITLIDRFQSRYLYAARMLFRDRSDHPGSVAKPFLGMAPTFEDGPSAPDRDCVDDALYSLQCSAPEVESIAGIWKGAVRSEDEAKRQSFIDCAGDYRILHLATHACVDAEDSENSRIYFSDDYLTERELYHLNLRATLAVLSACQTGSGEVVAGEGVMSLAKGFLFSGVSSTVVSLWSVDDCATSTIMTTFHEYLQDGRSKGEALRQAKLDYRSTVDKAHRHPYYWAAFVLIGDDAAIDVGSSKTWILVLVSMVLLLAFLLWQEGHR